MPDEIVGPEHILQIWATATGDQVDVFHPTGCTEGHPIDDGPGCPVALFVGEWYEEMAAGFGLGTWRVEMWGHPPYWAGATRMDGDAGVRHVGEYEQ